MSITLDPLTFLKMKPWDRQRFVADAIRRGDIVTINDIRNLKDFEMRFNKLETTEEQLTFYENEAKTCPNDEYRQQNLRVYDQVFSYLYGKKNNG